MRCSLLLLFLCVLQADLLAAHYYVRKDGNNANTGLADDSSKAWLTIQKAADTAVAGDTIHVAAGTYNETVLTKANGTSTARITFQGSTGAIVGAFKVSKAYTTIDGFTLTGSTAGGYDGVIQIMTGANSLRVTNNTIDCANPILYQINITFGVVATDILIDSNKFLNSSLIALVLAGSGGYTISNNQFTTPNGADAIRIYSSNIRIANNTFSNWSNLIGSDNHADLFQTLNSSDDAYCQNVIIENNVATDCVAVQIGNIADTVGLGRTSNWTWRNNIFANVEYAMSLTVPNSYFYNNTFYKCAKNAAQVLMFRGFGKRVPFSKSGVSLANSTITTDVAVDFATGAQIKFYNTPPAPLSSSSGSYFARVISSSTISIHPTALDATSGTNQILFTTQGSDSPAMGVAKVGAGGVADNCRVYNNLFIECGMAPASTLQGWYLASSSGTEVVSGFSADYNLVYGTTAAPAKTNFVALGRETNGINGQLPKFIAEASKNFGLQESSPVLGKGKVMNDSYQKDQAGNLRGKRWEMGALEYQGKPLNAALQHSP